MTISTSPSCTPETSETCQRLLLRLGKFGHGIDCTWRGSELRVVLCVSIMNPERVPIGDRDNYCHFSRARLDISSAWRVDYDDFMTASERGKMEMVCNSLIRSTLILDERYFPAKRKEQLIAQIEASRDLALKQCQD